MWWRDIDGKIHEGTGYIVTHLSAKAERHRYYHECMRSRVPYVWITEKRKFSHIMYDTAKGMESRPALDCVIERLRAMNLEFGWPKGCGLGCTDTLIGSVTGDIYRVPNTSAKAVAAMVYRAFDTPLPDFL